MIYRHFIQQHTQMCDLSAAHMNAACTKKRENIARIEFDILHKICEPRMQQEIAIEYKSTIS